MLRGFVRGVPETTMPQGRVEIAPGDRQDHALAIALIVQCVADGPALLGIDLLIVGAIGLGLCCLRIRIAVVRVFAGGVGLCSFTASGIVSGASVPTQVLISRR